MSQHTTSITLQQSELVRREKININSNTGFQEFPGSGTVEDPYIISRFEISAPASEDYNLITIASTNVYFIIENNFLTGNDQNSGSGISIVGATNGLIRNNEVRDNMNWGIFIADSENIIVEYNLIDSNTHQGLEILSARNNVIQHNIVSNNLNGIASYFSDNNDIFNNTVNSNSQNGIHIEEGTSHNIKGNLVDSNNGAGIWLGGAKSNSIESNEISSNSVGITFRDQTQLGNNPSDDNDVLNNLIFNNTRGITISNGNNNTFSQNIVDGNEGNGFDFNGGENNSITFSVVSNNEHGYRSAGSAIKNTIYCNTFELNRGFGVFIENDPIHQMVSRNDFLKNQNNPQASDNGLSNTFEQNYWDDFGDQDQNNDGINDIRYPISGNADNEDLASSPIRNTDLLGENSICNLDLRAEDLLNTFENITIPLVLEPRLEFPVSKSFKIGFPIFILLIVGITIFIRRKTKAN